MKRKNPMSKKYEGASAKSSERVTISDYKTLTLSVWRFISVCIGTMHLPGVERVPVVAYENQVFPYQGYLLFIIFGRRCLCIYIYTYIYIMCMSVFVCGLWPVACSDCLNLGRLNMRLTIIIGVNLFTGLRVQLWR